MYDLNEIVEKIVYDIKRKLNEGLSKRLFHFCPISAMYSIAKTDKFNLTSINNRPSDAKMTSLPIDRENRKQYQYYMCFSRTPSSLVGYVSMRRDKTGGINWDQSLVRIEVDGEKLGSNYKGMPVNYFNDKNLDKINHYYKDSKGNNRETVTGRYGNVYSKEMDVKSIDSSGRIRTKTLPRITPHADDKLDPRGKKRSQVSIDYGVIDRNQMSEYEDRLFSNQPFIKNVIESGIIKRVDIFINKNVLDGKNKYSADILYMVDEIIKIFGNMVHIYDNFSSFENVNIVNSIEGYKFKQQYLEVNKEKYAASHGEMSPSQIELLPSELRTIVKYATILGFYGFSNEWERMAFDNTLTILSTTGINTNDDNVKNLVMGFITDIKNCGGRFFQIQTSYLKKELEEIPPYKREQYIKKLEEIERMEINTFASRTGKSIGIMSIKANMCR